MVRRIHQKRSDYRVLGKAQEQDRKQNGVDVVIEDDDEDVEV